MDVRSSEGRQAKRDLDKIRLNRGLNGQLVTMTATPQPQRGPIVSGAITMPGEPPVPPAPVPDCSQWRYFVERWELISTQTESRSIPTIVGYETITFNFGGNITTYQVPKIVNVPVTIVMFTYEWVADEYTGCGKKVTTNKSGLRHTTSTMLCDTQLAQAVVANQAQVMQIQMWNEALLARANAIAHEALVSSALAQTTVAGAYGTAEEGLKATQRRIDEAMRDYAYKIDIYNAELADHVRSIRASQGVTSGKQNFHDQVEIRSNMIREDKVGSAYTVKGAGNKTLTLTVGQEISGSDLISSGIQSTGSGFNIDPAAVYIITDVEISQSMPRVNVPGLQGVSYPGVITITR